MEMIAIDIETYSDISLPDCGVHKYVSSDKFGVMLMAYSIDGGDVQLADFMAGEKLPEDVMEGLQDDSVIKTAFNAAFERNCLSKHFGIELKPESWRCTAVQASMLSLPLSLEGVAEALSLDKKKMSEGKELIRYFCVPCKPTKANGGRTRNMPSDAPEKWELFKSYCIRDVVVEMEIRDKLKNFPIPEKEQRLYCMDQRINDRGIMVDMGLVTQAMASDLLYKEAATKRAYELSGLENPNSVSQLKEWLTEKVSKWILWLKLLWKSWLVRPKVMYLKCSNSVLPCRRPQLKSMRQWRGPCVRMAEYMVSYSFLVLTEPGGGQEDSYKFTTCLRTIWKIWNWHAPS